ncbi:nucleoside triphosphate pyrophosphohydrolase [Ketobacter sp. MCCC 1A13808]|uniref:nucleoside triphosphate pyrophosphohydrolase n=1 Tax=Ketobacter sp. MCCC 1A13808 TaxID=2602738 RepID=UPI000F14D44A|nr:nucleoside triphosphate pyrophosphohydrolase [Ketobacter sp. MCCC 1A13808]MVF14676.1 nucleoside triphosphate pyrophosphohydrolase [Ketobacter sp. MCCC 1A13808]RLP53956.1 MAG: nucleoside triphosphate pyrophosphohydrolase [Ketobacter sp.]
MTILDIDLTQASPVERIRYLMARLRQPEIGCPWDQKQDFKSIAPFTIEEAYEVADTIARDDFAHLKEELGDLFFQVVFYGQMAEEQGYFNFDEVMQELENKLVRRHPHVFPAGTLESKIHSGQQIEEHTIKASWEAIKHQEKAEKKQLGESLLDTVPGGMAPVKRAHKIQSVVAKKGFDWQDPQLVMDKLEEEIRELAVEVRACAPVAKIADELGDLMFCCVNLARHYKLDPDMVMIQANHKFEKRFRLLEKSLKDQSISLDDASLGQMEQEWQKAKQYDE